MPRRGGEPDTIGATGVRGLTREGVEAAPHDDAAGAAVGLNRGRDDGRHRPHVKTTEITPIDRKRKNESRQEKTSMKQ